MIYCTAINYGDGFITANDAVKGSIQGYPNNVWVVADNHGAWVAKVGGTRKTKSEAQTLVNTAVAADQVIYDALSDAEKEPSHARPQGVTLP